MSEYNNLNKQSNDVQAINEQIKFPEIRLVTANGSQAGIVSIHNALKLAQNEGLDLVLVNAKSDPPVCRIINYGKYKFSKDKKAKEAKKKQHQATIKEVKMRYKIEEHDYKVRLNQAIRFLHANDKVKVTITFRGREVQHIDLAISLLYKMAKDLKDTAEVQQLPSKDGKNIVMILTPKRI